MRSWLIATLGITASAMAWCELASAQSPPPPPYTFDEKAPPAYSVYGGAILDMPDAALSKKYGCSTWGPVIYSSDDGWVVNGIVFTLCRVKHWSINDYPARWSTDVQLTVETDQGWSLTQATSMSQSLDTEVGASDFGLSGDVKRQLMISESTTESWHQDKKTTTQRTYKANTTYLSWYLHDTLTLHRSISFSGKCCATHSGQDDHTVDILKSYYEDFADSTHAPPPNDAWPVKPGLPPTHEMKLK